VRIAEEIATEDENGESARAAKQISAPSTSAAGATLVDAPSFTQLVALAFQDDLVAATNGTLTFSLNAWAFKRLAEPALDVIQARYGSNANKRLRRLGGSVSMGGKGEEFDRDGDGKKDPAIEAKNLTDSATMELRWRLWGTRDRRERESLAAYSDLMRSVDDDLNAAVVAARVSIDRLIAEHDRGNSAPILQPCDPPASAEDACLYEDGVQALYDLVKRELPQNLKTVKEALDRWKAQHRVAVLSVDRQSVWTVVLAGTSRQAEFGAAKVGAGLRGVFATGPWDHTVNVDWTRTDWRQYGGVGQIQKVGYAVARLLSRDPDADDGVKLTLEVAGEKYANVPGAKHDTLAKASVRLDVPLTETVSIPVTVNYASHTDLLTDQHQLTSHVGIAWDLSGLSKKRKKEE
jgi:hypothetical protein